MKLDRICRVGHDWLLRGAFDIMVDRPALFMTFFKPLRSRLARARIKLSHFPKTYRIDLQLAAARHLRWLIDTVETESPELVVTGWFLRFAQRPTDIRFLLNGNPFLSVEWPLPSKDVAELYGSIPGAKQARFVLRQPIGTWSDVFPHGYARLSAVNGLGEHPRSYRTCWYYPNPHNALPVPDGGRIARVIGEHRQQQFLLGGATIVHRLDYFLRERFGRPLTSFAKILDWGCGPGRITRHMIQLGCPSVVGADIDPDNIQWCDDNLKGAEFCHLQLHPPTLFADAQFDLVVGVSVMTHLGEADQFLWLAELERITKPGSLLLLSIRGLTQWSLLRRPPKYVALERTGFVDTGAIGDLKTVISDHSVYRNVDHSRDYIFAKWSKYFDVLDIVDAIAVHQDVVVLRRRESNLRAR